jgi:predicted restriction endonuclease
VTKILTIFYTMKWYGIEEQITWLYEELLDKINSLYYSLPGYKSWRIKSDKNWTIVIL